MLPVKTDVVIVGAGPTGLALAITLRKAGVDCVVIEKLAAPQANSRAAVIHAHTLDVLDRIGAAAPLAAAGLRLRQFSIRDRDRAMLQMDFTAAPSPHNYLLMLPQNDTERLLAEALVAAGGQVWRNCAADAVTMQPGGASVAVTAPDGRRDVAARFVVGADGMHSVVRQAAGIGYAGAANAESFILADVDMHWGLPTDDVMIFFSPDGVMVVAPLPDGRFRIVATLADAPEHPDAALAQSILRQRGPRQGQAEVTDLAWSSRFRVQHRLADAYRKGPLLLVGDAAHVHSPAGGQGMNTGLVDAVVLGQLLARVVAEGRPDTSLDAYERLRRPAAAEVLKLAGGLTTLATMRNPLARGLRNLGLGVVNALPPARRRLLLGLSGLGRAEAAQLPD
ncbi:2-polyprenyl-6-methoxyphenol hydroxylase-like FAD-dependent oxidoreductase [Devosia sp. UYZn731]|uniref:FAD-dependent oxidoreductase n=1 Tax=Devosia sp. UYZn731 TaxID=3156345 RepID=UPI00339B2DF1